MNYTELQTAVEQYTENTFLATTFATMTRLAEQKIYNSVQLPLMREEQNGTMTIGDPNTVSINPNVLDIYSLYVTDASGNVNYLLDKDVTFLKEAYPASAPYGLPKFYALDGSPSTGLLITIAPAPDLAYAYQLRTNVYPESIVTANATWLGDNFDSVLFNAVMVEAAREMKQEQDIVALYETQYVQSLTLFKNLVDGKMRQDAYRTPQVRTKVV